MIAVRGPARFSSLRRSRQLIASDRRRRGTSPKWVMTHGRSASRISRRLGIRLNGGNALNGIPGTYTESLLVVGRFCRPLQKPTRSFAARPVWRALRYAANRETDLLMRLGSYPIISTDSRARTPTTKPPQEKNRPLLQAGTGAGQSSEATPDEIQPIGLDRLLETQRRARRRSQGFRPALRTQTTQLARKASCLRPTGLLPTTRDYRGLFRKAHSAWAVPAKRALHHKQGLPG